MAERKNGHLLAITRTLLFQKNVSKQYWGEAILIATHLINRLPSRNLNSQSPLQLLSQFFPQVSISNSLMLRAFGCVAFVHLHSQHREKFDPRALRCMFEGYSPTQKFYKCFHSPTKNFFVSVDVTFVKQNQYFA